MLMDLQDRMAELMRHTGWTVADMARIAKVTSSAVSQWCGHGDGKRSKSIGKIEAAMRLSEKSGFSALWLAKGSGPKHLDTQPHHEVESERMPSHAGGEIVQNGAANDKEIPHSMPYSAPNLKSAILLMGSLVGALDKRSRKLVAVLLNDLTEEPDQAEDIAERVTGMHLLNARITNNKELNKALRGKKDPVETGMMPLEH